MQLGGVQLVEHLRSGHEDDALGGLAGFVSECASQERFAGAGDSDEKWVDSLLEEDEVVKREVARAGFLSVAVEIEVEAVDCVDLGEASIVDASLDGTFDATGFLFV